MAHTQRSEHISLVRTTCWTCGVIEVPLHNVVLRVDEETATGNCIVRCPLCLARFSQPACDAMMTALVAVGVEISLVVTPGATPIDGELTLDEIERFVDALHGEQDLVRLVHSDDPPPATYQ
ncbi:MAG: hypothetical protein GX868_19030, partial [Actinobacteria bacterium]|nr:hypothetical protein [Actinomycetota bacterium]